MINDQQVGEIMREIRKEKGFTSMVIAKKLNISQPKLSRIETGTQPITISLLSEFCIACQISLVEFFYILEENTQFKQYIKESTFNYKEVSDHSFIHLLESLTLEEKKAIIQLIDTFKTI